MKLADNMQIERQVATAEPVVGYGRVAAQLRQDILDGSIASGSWLRLQAIAVIDGRVRIGDPAQGADVLSAEDADLAERQVRR